MSIRAFYSTVLLIIFATHATAQNAAYYKLVQKADALFRAKQYKESARAFSMAFAAFGGKATRDDRYNAACAWAQAGNKDSALHHLQLLATKGNFKDYKHLSDDSDLMSLHPDKRWEPLVKQVTQNKERAEAKLNKPLVAQLEGILDNDQKYRLSLDSVAEKYGMDSKEVEEVWKAIGLHDSLNEIEVIAILEKYGWPGTDMVGEEGSEPIFLVIQHAPLKTQDKYLPMLREAVKKGNAKADWQALLEDRVAVRHGGKQIYGTQVMSSYLLPLVDPDNVDKRRASVGLGPLAVYLKNFGIAWDPAGYKKELPEIEAMVAAGKNREYGKLAYKAYQLYEAKQYKESALAFSKAFTSLGKTPPDDRYNAACSWALAGSKDSAFYHLQYLAAKANYKDYKHLLEDTDLDSLHTDKRWAALCKRVKQNKEKADAKLK